MQKYFSFDEYDAFRNLMLAMMNTRFCYFLIIHFTLNEPLKFKNLVKPKIRRKNLDYQGIFFFEIQLSKYVKSNNYTIFTGLLLHANDTKFLHRIT